MSTLLLLLAAVGATLVSVGEAAEEEHMTIGPKYHFETCYGNQGVVGKNIGWGTEVPPYKEYDNSPRTELELSGPSEVPLEDLLYRRGSVRSFTEQGLTLEQLARLMHSANGNTRPSSHGTPHRTTPSAGALYPMETYVIVSNVKGLEPGLYHYQVKDSSLAKLKVGDFAEKIHGISNEQESVGSSPITIIIAARFDRVTKKYADRGYRYCYMEAGAMCQNIYLQATAFGLGTVVVGAFNDIALAEFLEVDLRHEAGLLVMPVGHPK